ncbi:MAG TPA: FAD/NAD(P)-binding protein [Acidimicrobiales bacterium]|nr:FAD/NAD(P)-binding protein [Acidimicrobiales bacterium]
MSATTRQSPARPPTKGPFTPMVLHVASKLQEAPDVVTLGLMGPPGWMYDFAPGQFNMLTAFGVGEVPISISSPPGPGHLMHTVREVGAVTRALCRLPLGAPIGVRGPFGTDWGTDAFAQSDAVIVAGGIGLAPLRGAVWLLVHRMGLPSGPRRVVLLVGARSPDQLIFRKDLASWEAEGAQVGTTVDIAAKGWKGNVGLVTQLLHQANFDPARTMALICGPEVMMRFAVQALLERGVPPTSIRLRLSLERNMQCGTGLCGHCQLGPYILCLGGPVVTYPAASGLLTEAEL